MQKSGKENARIFVVGKDPGAAPRLQGMLRRRGILCTASHAAGIAGLRRQVAPAAPEIVVVHIGSRPPTGFKILRALQQMQFRAPCLVISSSRSVATAVRCIKAGADDYAVEEDVNRIAQVRAGGEKGLTDREISRQREIYEALLDARGGAGTGVAIVSGVSRRFIFVNLALARITGYAISDLQAMPSFASMVDPRERRQLLVRVERFMGSGRRSAETFRSTIVHREGHRIAAEISITSLSEVQRGRFVLAVSTLGDAAAVDEAGTRSEKALQESEQRFLLFSGEAKDYGMFGLDPAGVVVSWTAGAERISGYPEPEITGRDFALFFPEDERRAGKPAVYLRTAGEQGRMEDECWWQRKDGTSFWASMVITAVRDQAGTLTGFSTIVRDLTDRKRAEDQLKEQGERLRALARHLQVVREEEQARIARELHDELGQVLTALRMDLTIVARRLERWVDRPAREPLVEKIQSIAGLVEQAILSTRKIVTELRPAVLDELGLLPAIQWQAQEFEGRTGIRSMVQKTSRDFDVTPEQSTVLFRIFQEALTNVARHSHATQVTIALDVRGGDYVLEVRDDGRGLGENELSSPASFGLLGMRERVTMVGGTLTVRSGPGAGTTVIARIPRATRDR